MPLPSFDDDGNLPQGVFRLTLREAIDLLGTKTPQRMLVALRLERVCQLAKATGHVARFVVFGSFVTAKPQPDDVDVFMIMEDAFDAGQLTGETRLLFDHTAAQDHFGASVFWLRRLSLFREEQAAIEDWQITREGGERGIVEIIEEFP